MIEYIDAVVTARPPVKKQMWDGTKFVPVMVYVLLANSLEIKRVGYEKYMEHRV